MIELSKSYKKIARAIMCKGMMIEFEQGINKADSILNDWKHREGDPQEAYHKLYEQIIKFNKHIAQRYDNVNNTIILFVIVTQLNEGLIQEKEFEAFSEEIQAWIRRIRGL